MKGYSIKRCLTSGIHAVEIDEVYSKQCQGRACGGTEVEATWKTGDYAYTIVRDFYHEQLIMNRTFFESLDDAKDAARKVASKKLVSLRKALAKIEKLAVEPKIGQ
jgi:hypothetical protein